MFRSNAVRNFIVGIVFLGSLVAAGIATLEVSGVTWLARPVMVRVRFDQVSGLRTGDAVRIIGSQIGQVERIELSLAPLGAPAAARHAVLVTLRLNQEVPLTRDTRFEVKTLGPLGGNYVEITPGAGDVKAADLEFQGTAAGELFEELGDMVRENRDTLREALQEIRDAVRAINEREGALGALIRDPELRDRVAKAVENIENFTRAISEGEGTLGKIVMDRKLYDDIEDLIARVRRIAADADEGKGALGMLLKDEEFARDLKDGAEDLKEIIAKVNQGEGTVGQLVNNREAWDRLVFVLRQVQEAVEDFREQAPINTFVNAIFSAF